jgi:hypothetical protein
MVSQFRRTALATVSTLPSVACYLSALAVLVILVLWGVVAWAAIVWPALGYDLPGLVF